LNLSQQTRRANEMEEYEERTPDTDGRVNTHEGEASRRPETTDLLLRKLRTYLRIGHLLEAQTSEQRAAVARVAAALENYTDYFYPPDPH
jgi:hypothetical protein